MPVRVASGLTGISQIAAGVSHSWFIAAGMYQVDVAATGGRMGGCPRRRRRHGGGVAGRRLHYIRNYLYTEILRPPVS
jgi:hypothetical protein